MEKIYNRAEIIIAKQRHGPTGTIKLFFDGRLTKFGNLME
jgi:replicative DNA helicase